MKRLLPILAGLGLAIAVAAVIIGNRPSSSAPPLVLAPRSPYGGTVAGAGILEASSQNIAVGTPVAGIVSDVYVKWNERVKAGDPLFRIDDRDLQARLVSANAGVHAAQAVLAKAEHHLEISEKLKGTNLVSGGESASRADDVVISRASIDVAKAQLGEIRTEIERRTIRAPIAGRILRIDIRPGELAQSNATTTTPLMLLGDDDKLHVRVDIDERDAWRVGPAGKAVAFVRGNPDLKIPLEFVRIEPYIAPKTSLTGKTTERTDVRVLQAIYGFDHGSWPVYVGQQVDVFIEAPDATLRVK